MSFGKFNLCGPCCECVDGPNLFNCSNGYVIGYQITLESITSSFPGRDYLSVNRDYNFYAQPKEYCGIMSVATHIPLDCNTYNEYQGCTILSNCSGCSGPMSVFYSFSCRENPGISQCLHSYTVGDVRMDFFYLKVYRGPIFGLNFPYIIEIHSQFIDIVDFTTLSQSIDIIGVDKLCETYRIPMNDLELFKSVPGRFDTTNGYLTIQPKVLF